MKAKKALGQHFLNDSQLAANIANSMTTVNEFPKVLEIGPGKGILSQFLINQDYDFQAVELDGDMVNVLAQSHPAMKVIHSDFLKLDLRSIFTSEQFIIIGNFPYNISTEIIFKILKQVDLIPEMIGMFQKEVAERIISKHGSKVYGITSVLTQLFYEGEKLFDVPPHSFNPPPKVDSAVIRLTRKKEKPYCDLSLLKQIVKMGFNQRRKMLRNTLKSVVKNPEILKNKIFTLRPEQLSVIEFVQLTNLIEKENESGN